MSRPRYTEESRIVIDQLFPNRVTSNWVKRIVQRCRSICLLLTKPAL